MSIWVSSGAFRTTNFNDLLTLAANHGFYAIEMSSGLPFEPQIAEKVRAANARGPWRFQIHNYFPAPQEPFVLNIASLDGNGLRQTKKFAREAIDLAHDLSCPFYSIHAGFAAALTPEVLGRPGGLAQSLQGIKIDREAAYQVMIETTRELADYAASRGLDLLIENNVCAPALLEKLDVNPLLMTTAGEITTFIADVQRSNVGILLDFAHARVSATAQGFSHVKFVETVAPHVRCLHLSDNDGLTDSNSKLSQQSWFLPLLKAFADREIVLEVYRLEPIEIQQQVALIREHLN